MRSGRRKGLTVVELLVALTLLGLLAGIGTLSFSALRAGEDPQDESLRRERRQAIQAGRDINLRRDTLLLRFLPDGRVLEARLPHAE
jgi:prepilin-type N-terminal cleavage/methylation domain-containing protein